MRNKKINTNDTKPLIQRLLYYAYKFIELKQDEHKHFHPSGSCEPSEQDVLITDRMQEVYKLMDIKLLDHIIIGSNSYYSFTENSIMPDKQLSFTPIMELYQMKHGLEAKKESVRKQLKEKSEVAEKKPKIKKNKSKVEEL